MFTHTYYAGQCSLDLDLPIWVPSFSFSYQQSGHFFFVLGTTHIVYFLYHIVYQRNVILCYTFIALGTNYIELGTTFITLGNTSIALVSNYIALGTTLITLGNNTSIALGNTSLGVWTRERLKTKEAGKQSKPQLEARRLWCL